MEKIKEFLNIEQGYGYGDGDGIKKYNNMNVYIIDDIQTIITNISRNIAKGYILNNDLTLEPCYVAKGQNQFAHGKTIKEAVNDLQEKLLEDLDTDEAIRLFKEKFKQKNRKYKAEEFYLWHHILTGSCEMGRKSFAKNHNIDIDNDKFTVLEFIELTKDSYNGHIIKQLAEEYK